MNFPDLSLRLWTGIALGTALVMWLVCAAFYPISLPIGVTVLGGVCLYEWFIISKNQSVPFRFMGVFLIITAFLTWISFGADSDSMVYNSPLLIGPITDTIAYFSGRIIGGPKLCPTISPSKTWAGFLSAVFLLPILSTFVVFNMISFISIMLFCLAAQTGDILESWAKRRCGVKDSGSWLPGHGGLLDRMDSILGILLLMTLLNLISAILSPDKMGL